MVNVIFPRIVYKYTNKYKIVSGCKDCSFDYVSKMLQYYMKKYMSLDMDLAYSYQPDTLFVVTDLWWAMTKLTSQLSPPNAVYWVDTAWSRYQKPVDKIMTKAEVFVTTSPWNLKLLTNNDIFAYLVPRAVHDEYALKYFNPTNERKYVFTTIATVSKPDGHDKKNVQLAYRVVKDLGLYEKSFFICNYDFCHAKPFTLSDDQKFEILSQSKYFIWLSTSEGFGVPPVEAMSVGTPVIYNDSPYVNFPVQHKYNIPVQPVRLYELQDPTVKEAWFPWADFDYETVKKTFKEALSIEYTQVERGELHSYTMEHFSHRVIVPILYDLAKRIRGGIL